MTRGLEVFAPSLKDAPVPKFAVCVAEAMGGDIHARRIQDLIETSNRKGIIFHGISNPRLVPNVEQHGVLPNTPEGGFVSYWSMGESLFGTQIPRGITTFDSTFFHYAYSSKSAHENRPSMHIAVTMLDLIEPRGEIRPNQQVQIKKLVRRSELELLTTEGESGNKTINERMFELLEEAASNFLPGTTLRS
jgi:hypothetical protein